MSVGISSVVPTSAFMLVWDVTSWIAFRQVRERDDIKETLDFMNRWLDSDVGPTLEALKARADPEPFYFVQYRQDDWQPSDRLSYVHRAFSPEAPKLLRAIRAKARKRERRLVTFAELANELQSEIAGKLREAKLIDHAQRELMGTVQAARLTVWARRDVKRGQENPTAVHEPVPVSIFMDDRVTITEWGTIGADHNQATAIHSYHGPQYRDAKFKTTEILELWPPAAFRIEYDNNSESYPSKPTAKAKKYGESCILTDAIGRLVYGSNYDGRYYATPGNHYEEIEARHVRISDIRYPTTSGLPNVPKRSDMSSLRYDIATTLWAHEDTERWKNGEDRLHAALAAGSIKAFDANGRAVRAEFWLANNCRSSEAYRFRIRGSDLTSLESATAGSANTVGTQLASVASTNPPEATLISDRTGMPGRPTSAHLVKAELQTRADQGKLEATVTEESKTLVAWLSKSHPTLAPMTARTVENAIRDQFRTLRGRTKL